MHFIQYYVNQAGCQVQSRLYKIPFTRCDKTYGECLN